MPSFRPRIGLDTCYINNIIMPTNGSRMRVASKLKPHILVTFLRYKNNSITMIAIDKWLVLEVIPGQL